MEFFDRLEAERERWNVLDHPFYTRWERGELSQDDLACYADEYRHAVAALARTAAQAAEFEPELRAHADEEAAHVALWDDFARAAGATGDREPLPETEHCVEAWTAADDGLEALAILYAVESAQPEISRTKLAGLVGHYGYAGDSPATGYFRLHAELDRAHADQARCLIEESAQSGDVDRLVAAAKGALVGNWRLLDGVEAALS